MPDFWLGMILLTTLGVGLGLFPVGGIVDPASDATGIAKLMDQAQHMFLPALTLALAYLGEYALIMRSSLLDTMREDYLVLARAKGLRDVQVRNRHAVPNALLPVVALGAINFGLVLSGAIAVEAIFSWPGLGPRHLRGAEGPRPPDAPGDVPRLQRVGDRVQPGRRPPATLPRPAGAAHVSTAAATSSPRRIAWTRRRRAAARAWGAVPPAHAGDDRARDPGRGRGRWRSPRRCSPTRPSCTPSTRPRTLPSPARPSSAARHRQASAATDHQFIWGVADQPPGGPGGDGAGGPDRLGRRDRRPASSAAASAVS